MKQKHRKNIKRFNSPLVAGLFILAIGVTGTVALSVGNAQSTTDVAAPYTWHFNTDGNPEGWKAWYHISSMKTAGGSLNAVNSGPLPQLRSPNFLKSSSMKKVTIRLKNNTSTSTARLKFSTREAGWQEVAKKFSIIPNSDFTEYKLDMSDMPNWNGTINAFRFDIVMQDQTTGSFNIDWLSIH